MIVTSAKFIKTGAINAIISGQQMFVPNDMDNGHRVAIAQWEKSGNVIEPYAPELEPLPVTVIPSVTFWERMTETEAEQVYERFNLQSFRTQQIFITAQSYRSDHELWPLLHQVAVDLFGAERATELLASPLI